MAIRRTEAGCWCLRHVDVIAVVFLLEAVLLVGAGIIYPTTNDVMFLKQGDKLHLICEQKASSSSAQQKNFVWSKANTYHGSSRQSLQYQTIDPAVYDAPYVISHRNGNDSSSSSPDTDGGVAAGGGVTRLVSELVKKDVSPSDSGYYRCRLGVGGPSSQILVTVFELTTKDGYVERINADANMSCVATDQNGNSNFTITWFRHGQPVVADRSKHVIQLGDDGATSVLTIRRVRGPDVGEYFCGVGVEPNTDTDTPLGVTVNLFAVPYVKAFDRSENVVAGHTLELICRAWGWRTPNITWYRDGVELSPAVDDRVRIGDAPGLPPSSRLLVDNIGSVDRAHYTCTATSVDWNGVARHSNATVFVRVKGKLAALWPLLGLGIEVILLCAIIVAYEMKRNKQETLLAGEDGLNDHDKTKTTSVANSNHSPNSVNEHARRRKDN